MSKVVKKVSLVKPKESEVIDGVPYVRSEIRNVYSNKEHISHWEYLERVDDKAIRAKEIQDQIKELESQLKSLGVNDEYRDTTDRL